DERPYARPDAAERLGRGLMLLTVGLAKKVFLGDPLAVYVNPVFQAAEAGQAVSAAEAWQAEQSEQCYLEKVYHKMCQASQQQNMVQNHLLWYFLIRHENF
ncbi:hypothetical protein LNK20_20035, partial [Bacillus safensis]